MENRTINRHRVSIVLDVKTGSGVVMKEEEDAFSLAKERFLSAYTFS